MAPPGSPSPFTVGGPMLNMIFQSASDGNLSLFKRLVVILDMGRGRLKETVEALRVEDAGLLEGLGALHVAAIRGRLEVCRYLVEELQVDVNGVDKGGRTCLFFAILSKDVGIAKYLLDHGANPNKVNNDGISPLHQATVSGGARCIRLFKRRILSQEIPILCCHKSMDSFSVRMRMRMLPLLLSSKFMHLSSGDCEAVKLLLAKGAYVDPVASCGTPLHCAATEGHADILKILLDHNADRNKMVDGKTPLIAAVDADSRNCMLLLIRAGADAKGALTYAAENLHSEKLVSTDFVNCIMEDVAANRVVPDADEPVFKKKIRAAGFKKLANHSFKEKDYLAAAGSYSVAMILDPEDATVYSNRSVCLLLMGEGDKALIDANECRKMRPDWPKACYRQGAALMLLKDYKGACQRFLEGLKLDPANTEIEDALRKAYDAMRDVLDSEHKG